MSRLTGLAAAVGGAALMAPASGQVVNLDIAGTVDAPTGGSQRVLNLTPQFHSPDDFAIEVSGTLDLNGFMVSNGAILLGVLPADDTSFGLIPTGRGAWGYFTGRATQDDYRMGPSNGNVGGEIIDTSYIVGSSADPSDNVFDFTMTIYDGSITFNVASFSHTLAYTDDFSSGAVFTIDSWSGNDEAYSFAFDVSVSQIPAPGAIALAALGGLCAVRRRRS